MAGIFEVCIGWILGIGSSYIFRIYDRTERKNNFINGVETELLELLPWCCGSSPRRARVCGWRMISPTASISGGLQERLRALARTAGQPGLAAPGLSGPGPGLVVRGRNPGAGPGAQGLPLPPPAAVWLGALPEGGGLPTTAILGHFLLLSLYAPPLAVRLVRPGGGTGAP